MGTAALGPFGLKNGTQRFDEGTLAVGIARGTLYILPFFPENTEIPNQVADLPKGYSETSPCSAQLAVPNTGSQYRLRSERRLFPWLEVPCVITAPPNS